MELGFILVIRIDIYYLLFYTELMARTTKGLQMLETAAGTGLSLHQLNEQRHEEDLSESELPASAARLS